MNGQIVGSPISYGESFSYQVYVSDYEGGINSLGWCFVNETGTALDVSVSVGDMTRLQTANLVFTFTDDSIAVASETSNDGFFKSIIQWLSSIKDAIVSLPSRIADFVISGIRSLFEDEYAEAEEGAQDFSAVGDELANYGFADFDGNRTESELQLLFGDNPFMKVVGYVICIGFVGMVLKKAVS